jgi:hypothetical protein
MNEQPKSTPWKVIIPVAIVVILCCICLAVAGVLAYLGTQGSGPLSMLATATSTPTKIPTRTSTPTPVPGMEGNWDIYYSWECSNYSGPVTVTFYPDGTYYAVEDTSGGYGTWTLIGNALDYIYDEYPYAHYIGTVNSTLDYAEGTMSTSDGSSGCWYGYPSTQGSIAPSVPGVENTYGDWDLYYDWDCTGTFNGPGLLTFYSDQTYSLTEDGDTGYGTWFLTGDYMDFIYDTSPYAHYIGTLDSSFTFMEGTMSTNDGSNGCWYAIKR